MFLSKLSPRMRNAIELSIGQEDDNEMKELTPESRNKVSIISFRLFENYAKKSHFIKSEQSSNNTCAFFFRMEIRSHQKHQDEKASTILMFLVQ